MHRQLHELRDYNQRAGLDKTNLPIDQNARKIHGSFMNQPEENDKRNEIALSRRSWLKAAGGLVAMATSLRAEDVAGADTAVELPLQLSINENAFGPSRQAVAAMTDSLKRSFRYPHAQNQQLIAMIAEKENVPADHILMGVGSGEILLAYGRHFGAKKGEIIAAVPGYTQMIDVMQGLGSKVVKVPLNDKWEHDLEAMATKVTAETSCVYICNPNNPTGTLCDAEKLKSFAIGVSKKVPVFIDEAYLECSDDFAANTMVDLVKQGHDVMVSRTFSKIYGLAGLRVGYAVASPRQIAEVRAQMSGNPNLMGAVAALASLKDKEYLDSTRAKIKAGRDAIHAVLRDLGKKHTASQANFVFFQTGMPIEKFQEAMSREQVIVARPFPPMLDWCRLTIGQPAEMAHVHRALRKILG
jgi:histidinol-phosphate aminotransferase